MKNAEAIIWKQKKESKEFGSFSVSLLVSTLAGKNSPITSMQRHDKLPNSSIRKATKARNLL